MWRTGKHVVNGAASDGFAGILFAHYLREDLSITFSVSTAADEAGVSTSPEGRFAGASDLVFAPAGVRWNPFLSKTGAGAIKPYAVMTLGPIFGSSAGTFVSTSGTASVSGAHDEITAGGELGGGVDFHLARWFSIGVTAGYNWMIPFEHAVGSRTSYNGAQMGLGFGFLFGKGR